MCICCRLKAADLELKRSKVRLVAFREKVNELESSFEPLRAENERLSKTMDKIDALKATINRKDALLKNYRDQTERSKSDFDALKEVSESRRLEFEKRIRYAFGTVPIILYNYIVWLI